MTVPADSPEQSTRASSTPLSDGVVSLAPFELADAVTVMAWDADPDIQRWFDWPLTPSAADSAYYPARLASAESTVLAKQAAWRHGTEFSFLIHSSQSGEGLGWVDLKPRGAGRGNVAYGVLPAHRRQGIATRSVILASRYAFEVLGWARLEIRTNADNAASRAAAVRSGFELDGVLRSYGVFENHEPLRGQRFDEAVYSRLRTNR